MTSVVCGNNSGQILYVHIPYVYYTWISQFLLLKTMKNQTRDERFDLRLSADIKALVARAAEVSGMTMSAFMIESARERATRLIEENELIILNNEARDMLMDMLANPPEPAEPLRRAAKKYAIK